MIQETLTETPPPEISGTVWDRTRMTVAIVTAGGSEARTVKDETSIGTETARFNMEDGIVLLLKSIPVSWAITHLENLSKRDVKG